MKNSFFGRDVLLPEGRLSKSFLSVVLLSDREPIILGTVHNEFYNLLISPCAHVYIDGRYEHVSVCLCVFV